MKTLENATDFEEIVLLIDKAIESEVGEQREYSTDTETYLSLVQMKLREALKLPDDFTL